MSNASEQIPLTSLGLDAAQVLRGGARGTVAAIFRPVTLCAIRQGLDLLWRHRDRKRTVERARSEHELCALARPRRDGDSIKITDIGDGGGAWHVRTHDVKIWRAPVCGPASPQRIRSRLEELPCRLPAGIPAEGLACFIWRPASPRSAVAQAAVPCVRALADWIAVPGRGEPRGLPEALARLIGLGPGLTPSGDDFLAGALATLHRLGRREEADSLWRLIEPLTPERTHPISISHLRAAARGGLSEALTRYSTRLPATVTGPGLIVGRTSAIARPGMRSPELQRFFAHRFRPRTER